MPVIPKEVQKPGLRPYWQSQCGRYIIYKGDCREVLAQLPIESVSAVVTDPPYGLEFMGKEFDAPWKHQMGSIESKKRVEYLSEIFATAFFDVVLPDYKKLASKTFNLGQLSFPTLCSAALAFMDRTIWEESRIAMPERAVDFNHRVVFRDEEVKDTDITASVIPNSELVDKLNTYSFEEGPHFFLNLRPCGNPSFGDSLSCFVSECGDSRLRLPIVIPLDSCFAGFLHTLPQSSNTFLGHIVRFLNNPLRCSGRPSFVMTSAGAELRAVLSIDLSRGTAELLPTDGTLEDGFIFELRCAKFVGTPPRASSLPTMFQSRSFRFVESPADRTFSICFHTSILSQIEFINKPWKNKGYTEVADEGTHPSHPFRDGSKRVVYGGGGNKTKMRQLRAAELSDPVKAKYLRHSVEYVRDSKKYQEWFESCAIAILRVCKPGAHLLSFGGTRMFHRTASAIEDAGFEIRDCVMWVYGSGFCKGLNVAKAIDRKLGVEGTAVGIRTDGVGNTDASLHKQEGFASSRENVYVETEPTTPEAKKWDGWNTSLKPAYEPITVARVPLIGTVAENVLAHGTGGINIDGCRVGPVIEQTLGGLHRGSGETVGSFTGMHQHDNTPNGRWPANICHDNSDEVVSLFPDSSGGSASGYNWGESNNDNPTHIAHSIKSGVHFGDSGSAARFFYSAKADRDDRGDHNNHPTCKPVDLMCWLVRLVTPKDALLLDPFMGSGTTALACIREGVRFIGIEQDEHYCDIAIGRIQAALAKSGEMAIPIAESEVTDEGADLL